MFYQDTRFTYRYIDNRHNRRCPPKHVYFIQYCNNAMRNKCEEMV